MRGPETTRAVGAATPNGPWPASVEKKSSQPPCAAEVEAAIRCRARLRGLGRATARAQLLAERAMQ